MVLEAGLLFGIVLLLPFTEVTSVPFLLVFAGVMALCIPVFRYVPMHAPPFVPTTRPVQDTMLALAQIRPGETVIDPGCGDGRLLRAAAERGAAAIGYEISLPTYFLAMLRTIRHRQIAVRYGNFWKHDFSTADVILCYLLPSAMAKFEREIWPSLKSGCRLVSHDFRMPTVEPQEKRGGVYLYVKC